MDDVRLLYAQLVEANSDGRDDVTAHILSTAMPVYLLGRNEDAKALLDLFPVAGIIDDFEKSATHWCGHPIVRGDMVPDQACIINCSTSIRPLSTDRRMRHLKGALHCSYADLLTSKSINVPLPTFVARARDDIRANGAHYQSIYDRLADEDSRNVFRCIMAFRLTADYSHMQPFSVRLRDQYFEPFLGPLSDITFVDCGGYDGDTSEEFALRTPDYGNILLFEPSAHNMAKAKQRLAHVRDITFIPLGISDTAARLSFNTDAGSASSVSDIGDTEIEVTTLDSFDGLEHAFIKMDLEGWEIPALKGASTTIVQHNPLMAIAVYHDVADFWKIPEHVLSLNQNYHLYLRHYTEGWSESVMYFIPS